MTWELVAVLAVLIASPTTLYIARWVGRVLKTHVELYQAAREELMPNNGKSMRDRVAKIEKRGEQMERDIKAIKKAVGCEGANDG